MPLSACKCLSGVSGGIIMFVNSLRRLTVTLLSIVFLVICVEGQEDLASKALPSVVTLTVQKSDGSVQTGNGFLTVRDGIVATAWHIVKDAKRVVAKFPGGDEYECSGLIDKDETRNIALIRIKVFGRPLLKMSPDDAAAGRSLNLAGVKDSAFGLLPVKVAEAANSDGTVWAKLEGDTPPNNSGSPLIDDQGAVVGIMALRKPAEKIVGFMIPARFILALDSSLPTQPWSQIPSSVPLPQPTATPAAVPTRTPDLKEIDVLIGSSYQSLSDNLIILAWADRRKAGYGFKNGVPKEVYDLQQTLEAYGAKLAEVRTDDQLRARVIKSLLQMITAQKASSENFIRAVVIAQQYQVWGAQSQDALSRASSLQNSISAKIKESLTDNAALEKESATFRDYLFPAIRYWLGLAPRPSGYSLGVETYSRNQYYLLVVYADSLAGKIGLKPGDTIKTVAGRDLTKSIDIEDLKLIIKENLGNKIDAVVERDGKIENIKLKIPKEIPAEAIIK